MRYRCPNCKTVNMLDIKDQGTQISCGRCDNSLTVPSDYVSPGVVFGDFALLEKVLSRSHETDFRAEQISLQREVILKIIKPELCNNGAFVKSFLEASRSASQLSHPYVCQIFGVGKENDIYFLAREVGGTQSLRDHLIEKGVIHWKGALKLTSEIAEALDFCWNHGQVRHLNLKPDYFIVDVHNHARLADIGMAGLNPDPGSDRIIGTPQYIAPERIVGLDGDNRSDLYSLGVSLFFMLTGQFPFKAENTSDYIDKHLNEAPRRANTVLEDIPEVVCDIINMLLEKNPNMRYQSGEALIHDIKAILRGQDPTYVYNPESQPVQPAQVVTPAIDPVVANPPTLTVRLEDEAKEEAPPVHVAPAAPAIKIVPRTQEQRDAAARGDTPEVQPTPAVAQPAEPIRTSESHAVVETEESAENSVQAALDDLDNVFTDFSLDEVGIEDTPPAPASKADEKEISTTFDTHIDVDDVFSDLDNIFDDLDAELEVSTADELTGAPIQSEEFNRIVAELADDPIKTPLPVIPEQEPPVAPQDQFPRVVPAVQGEEKPIAMAQPVDSEMSFMPPPIQPEEPELIQSPPVQQPIIQGIPVVQAPPAEDPVADEVDALFDEDLPEASPDEEAPTSFPALSGQNQAPPPAPRPEPTQGLQKKKKFKTRSKTKINFRRK